MQQAGKTNETGSCCLDTNIKRGRAFPGIPPRIIQWHGPVRLALRTSATNEKRAVGWGWGRRGESVQGQCGRVRGTALWMSGGGWGKRSWINESSVRRSWVSSCAKRKLDSQNDQLDLCIIAGRFFFHTRTQTHTHTQTFQHWQDGVRQRAVPSVARSTTPCRPPLSLHITHCRLNTGSRTD